MGDVILQNVQVGSRGDLQGKVKDTGDEETTQFAVMNEEMNEHFNNDQMVALMSYNAVQNEICAGKVGTIWYRVRISVVLSRRSGLHASCFLVDEGRHESIPTMGLRQLPPKFKHVPHQMKQIFLYGIQPLSMMLDDDVTVSARPVKEWDESAVKFIQDHISNAVSVRGAVMERSVNGALFVRMFLERPSGGLVCLNEALVNLRYATNVSSDQEQEKTHTKKPHKTIEEVIRARHRKTQLEEAKHDTDATAKSDTEYLMQTRSRVSEAGAGRGRPCMMEGGYLTDTQAVSAVSHRFIHKVPEKQTTTRLSNGTDHSSSTDLNSDSSSDQNSRRSRSLYNKKSPVNDITSVVNVNQNNSVFEFSTQAQQNRAQFSEKRPNKKPMSSDDESSNNFVLNKFTSPSDHDSRNDSFPSSSLLKITPSSSNTIKTEKSPTCAVGRGIAGYGRGMTPTRSPSSSVSSVNEGISPSHIGSAAFSNQSAARVKEHGANSSTQESQFIVPKVIPSPVGRGFVNSVKLERTSPLQQALAASDRGSTSESDSAKLRLRSPGMTSKQSDVRQHIQFENASEQRVSAMMNQGGKGISQTSSLENAAKLISPTKGRSLAMSPGTGNQGRSLPEISSGNESSSSSLGVVVASMTGQGGFKKSRVPGTRIKSDKIEPKAVLARQSDSEIMPNKMSQRVSLNSIMKQVSDSEDSRKCDARQETQTDRQSTEARNTKRLEMMGVIQGQKLLAGLKGSSVVKGPSSVKQTSKTVRDGKKMFGWRDNILVHGSKPRRPFYNIGDAHFVEYVVKDWESNNFAGPSFIQAYTWPSIVQGRDVVFVSPANTQSGKTLAYLYPLISALSEPTLYKEISSGMGDWESNNFAGPSLIQAYTWPSIVQGRHVVSVSPSNTGKTLAYLYPLISFLSEPNLYNEISTGMGPYVILLVTSWRSAEMVYYKACSIMEGRRGTRVALIHGGGQEENKACSLINGCEVMVVTPPCLKRLLDAGYTDLRRLCHLVIDDADQVLHTFTQDVCAIMQTYTEILGAVMKHSTSPRQILLAASQWNEAMESFIGKFLNEPVLIITSAFEASIYGKVTQITHMCHDEERMREVLGLLETITPEKHRTIIFSANKKDIINLNLALKNCSHHNLMVHQDMDLEQVHQVADEWADSILLLICCDEFITEMGITNAETIIHYDMPNSKTKFANRLSCLRQYYQDFSKPSKKNCIQPMSHLIISSSCAPQVKSIHELLRRSHSNLPPKLHKFMEGIMAGREESEERALCDRQLAFGVCRNRWRCWYRHYVIPDIDVTPMSSWLPDEGEVKVLVTYVKDASHYFVRLLSVRHHDMTTKDLSPQYSQLQMELAVWFTNLANQKRHTAPCARELCGYKENELFYRVEILDIREMNRQAGSRSSAIEAVVKFVDSGRIENIPAFKLYELPEKLKEIPYQAIEVYVCRVRPIDKDIEWTSKANVFIHELLHGTTLEGKIVLRLGFIMWFDPLVMRLTLGESRTIINKFYVHTELMHNGLANENPEHLKKLYKLCEGKVKIPKALLVKTRMSQILQTDVLPACKQIHDVHVSSVENPGFFFVQRKEKGADLEELMTDINTYIGTVDGEDGILDLPLGSYCLAEYTSYDKRWYRGQIIKVMDNEYEVFFADYGDQDVVAKDKVREIPIDSFYELPLQAIECKLANVSSLQEDGWTEDAGNALWDISHFVNNDLKDMVAHVQTTTQATLAGRSRFVVQLQVDRTLGVENFNIAEEMVWRNLAKPSATCDTIKPLFERPLQKKIFPSVLDKIRNISAALYWEQDPSKAMNFATSLSKEIQSSLIRTKDSPSPMTEAIAMKVLGCIVKLIGRVRWGNVHSVVFECLLCLAKASDRLCEELLHENCVARLIYCLEMNNVSIMQIQGADSIAKLSNVSTRLKNCFQTTENMSVLFELLEYTQSEQVQGSVCRAFTALCSGSDSVYQYLMKMSICQKLVKCLCQSSEHSVTEAIVVLIATLTQHDSVHSDLKKESLIEALVKNLSKTNCDKCIHHSVLLCDNFAATKRKHKTLLLELDMVPILTRLLQLDLQSTTKQLCKDLLSSLVVKVPSEPIAGHLLRPEEHNSQPRSANSGVPPPICWSQNSLFVMLSVKVTNAPQGDNNNMVNFNENCVKFRATIDGVCYAFNYVLFEGIIPVKCKIAVKSHEVLISMKKVVGSKWPRLLLQKQKPVNLSVDYERFVDSSSDSEDNDEERPFVLKKKKKFARPFSSPRKPKKKPEQEVGDGDLDNETETDDSLEDMEDPDDRQDYDPFT